MTEDDGADAATSTGLVLLRPPSDDSPHCEITICFKDRHEIHRVYMRSTARIYEIYYACDLQNSCKEYLCTVRCGAAEKVVTAPSVTEGATMGSQEGNKGTAVILEHVVGTESNNSDDDGWVKVKIPDSPLMGDRMNFLSKGLDGIASQEMQLHYEATAEISDASPCVSLTLRLLSLQTKERVHVEEIYIYADPVESICSDSQVNVSENMGGSSLLAMLVPGLLQLPKSGTNHVQDKYFSDEPTKAAQTISSDIGRKMSQESCASQADQKLGPEQEPTKFKPENSQLGPSQKLEDPDQVPKPAVGENNPAYSRVELTLDELVSRVGRIEAFCLRFEENMMKPLSCIDTRLQRLEQQLDAFTLKTHSSEQLPSTRIRASEFSFDESNSENKGNTFTEATEDTIFHETPSPVDELTASSVTESQLCPGLVFKAPEFPNEDDECTNTDNTQLSPGVVFKAPEFPNDDECSNADNTPDSMLKADCPEDNRSNVSIDGALASALAALLTSTTVKSPMTDPNLLDIPQESSSDNSGLSSSTVRGPSEGTGKLLNKSVIVDNGCDLSDAVRKETCFVDVAAPDSKFNEFDMKKKDCVSQPDSNFSETDMKNIGCVTSDVVREGTASDDSLLADDDGPSHVMGTGSVFTVPEFLNEDGSLSCDDTLESHTTYSHRDQASVPTDGQSITPLAAYLSLRRAQSLKSSPTMIYISSKLSNPDSKVTIGVPTEGKSGIENHGNDMKGKVDLDPSLNVLPAKSSLEQKEHDYTDGGATSNCILPEDSIEQKDHADAKRNDQHSMRKILEELFTRNCNGGRWIDDDNDAEEAVAYGDYGLRQLGREWAEDSSSTGSSFDESYMKNKVQIDWSDGGSSSTDSFGGAFSVNQHNWQATAAIRSESTISHIDLAAGESQSSAGHSQEKSTRELEWPFIKSMLEFEDVISSPKFAPERNWVTGLPLEVLLGELSDSKVQNSSANKDEHDVFATGQQHYPSRPSQAFLLEVEDLTPQMASSSGDNVMLQGPGRSNQQPFSNLI